MKHMLGGKLKRLIDAAQDYAVALGEHEKAEAQYQRYLKGRDNCKTATGITNYEMRMEGADERVAEARDKQIYTLGTLAEMAAALFAVERRTGVKDE